MVMLSALLRRSVRDRGGNRARLRDLAVGDVAADHPEVTEVLLDADRRLPWGEVERVAEDGLQVRDLTSARPGPPRADEVLLRRDVLDALILDLLGRQVTRANDLALAPVAGRLELRAADTSAGGVLRRLAAGRASFGGGTLHDWKYLEFLRGRPEAASDGAGYNRRVARLPAGEIATLATPLPYLHAAELVRLLPLALAADVMELLPTERQLQVFEELPPAEAGRLLGAMAPDLAADLIGCLEPAGARRALGALPRRAGEAIVELLRYPEGTVGSIMTNDVLTVPLGWRVGEARRRLRQRLAEPDFVYFVYVVAGDDDAHLRGVVTLRDLLRAGDEEPIADLANPFLVTLAPLHPARDAAYRVLDSHLAALPVVAADGRLLGMVTVDAAVALVTPRRLAGQTPRVFG